METISIHIPTWPNELVESFRFSHLLPGLQVVTTGEAVVAEIIPLTTSALNDIHVNAN
jgi:hypothetical protein